MATATRTRRTTKPADAAGADTPAPAVPDFSTNTPAKKKAEPRRPLFSIDGREFTVPKEVGGRITYLGLERMRTDGPVLSSMYLTELLLGRDQYTDLLALYEEEKLTEPQFDQIAGLISDIFFKRANAVAEPDETGGKGGDSAPDSTTS